MPDWVNIFGKKEELSQVQNIYVVDIKEFLDKYTIDPKQKKALICNHLNQWLKNRPEIPIKQI
jgi:F0F1-type ATP synthase delta subunit